MPRRSRRGVNVIGVACPVRCCLSSPVRPPLRRPNAAAVLYGYLLVVCLLVGPVVVVAGQSTSNSTTAVPNAAGIGVVISAHPDTTISVESVRSSAGVTITFAASAKWNLSCVVHHFSDSIFTVTPQSKRFGFSIQNVFPGFVRGSATQDVLRVVSGRPTALEVRFGGPAPRFLPERFVEDVTVRFPVGCFTSDISSGGPLNVESVNPVTIRLAAPNDRSTQEKISLVASCAIALGAVASGSSGWIGLSGLQSFLIMANSTCAETYTTKYFEDAVDIVVVPFVSVSSGRLNNAEIFGLSIGTCMILLAMHITASTVAHRCCYGGATRTTWRAVSHTLYFPGPFLFACVYLWLGITVTAYQEVVVASSGTFARPALVVAWAALAGLLAILWYDGLKRGFDGHFELYPWYQSQAQRVEHHRSAAAAAHENSNGTTNGGQSAAGVPFQFFQRFGRFQFIFLPKGRWVSTRGFGVLRANCDDRSCSFAPLTLFAVAAFGAVVVNNTDCDWYFGSIIIVEVLYLAAFAVLRPFRIPLLNLMWLAMKLTILVIAALHLFWRAQVTTPNNNTAISIRLACTAFVGLCGVFVGYNLVVNVIERSIETSARLHSLVVGDGAGDVGNLELRRRQATLLGFLGFRGGGWGRPRARRAHEEPPTTLKDLQHGLLESGAALQYSTQDDEGAAGASTPTCDLLELYQSAPPLLLQEVRRHPHHHHADDESIQGGEPDVSSFMFDTFGPPGAHHPPIPAAGDNDRAVPSLVPLPGSSTGDRELEEILVDMHLRLGPAVSRKAAAHNAEEEEERRGHHRWPDGGGIGGQLRLREAEVLRARGAVASLLTNFWHADDSKRETEEARRRADDHLSSKIGEPLLVVKRNAIVRAGSAQPSDGSCAAAYGQRMKPAPSRVALKVEPIPNNFSTNQFAFLMEAVTGPNSITDITLVGKAMFVGVRCLKEAEAIGTSLHNRELFGQVVQCIVIEDAMPQIRHSQRAD